MLAHRLSCAAAAFALYCSICQLAFSQAPTLPSQKNTPAPVSPPTVHVPSARQQMFAAPGKQASADTLESSRRNSTANPENRDSAVRQMSFQDTAGETGPKVPEVLRNGNRQTNNPATNPPSMPQRGFRIEDAGTVGGHVIKNPAVEVETTNPKPEDRPTTPNLKLPVQDPAFAGNETKKNIATTPANPITSQVRVSAFDKNRQAASDSKPANTGNDHGIVLPANIGGSAPPNQGKVSPAAMFTPVRENSESMAVGSGEGSSRFSFATPMIQIETFGPESIGIHKKSQFKIIARNQGSVDAERLALAITMPTWVRMENVNATTGRKEVGEDQRSSRVLWSIDRISANSTQTISIDVVPQKAEMFDLQVEVVQQPRTGLAHVEVTEPRLDMKIAGPTEVLFGETATYQVTVRNPGTGKAESVSVMLPEALGGERATLGDIGPGEEKNFRVELLARTAGALDLATTATAVGNLQTSATKQILVRRAELEATIKGPPMKYAGSVGVFDVEIRNKGDATAREVVAALAVPTGVRYIEGIDAVDVIESGLRWTIGTLDAGDVRQYRIALQLNVDGRVEMELGARAQGEIASVGRVATTVETVSDLVLSVEDPKGPLPTGQEVEYVIRIRNRGSRAAKELNLVMNFSDGIEPHAAAGHEYQLGAGQVVFGAINKIEPGQEVVVQVAAKAQKAGTHIFRAQLTGEGEDVREMAEGTTRFYGDDAPTSGSQSPVNNSSPSPPNRGGGTFQGN